MRQVYDQWKKDIFTKHPDAKVSEVKQFGGLVGAFAWKGTQHVGSWPDYLIPGYTILEPVPGDYA